MSTDILIVDDSLTVRTDLVELFREAGFEADACSTGRAARHALAQRRYGLLVLGAALPDGDGADLLAEIRGSSDLAELPIVMLSNEAEILGRLRGSPRGADAYVGKPYDPAHVLACAKELLADAPRGDHGGHECVLLVDDSPTFRQAMKSVLAAAAFQVLEAETGEEGLKIAAERRPSAIIVDGFLPGIDGSTVIRRVRLDAALRRTPCLLLTASDDRNDEVLALDAGADAFVRKDCDLAVIMARFSAMLRGAGAPSEELGTESLSGQKTVLAVDDSATFRYKIARLLCDRGFRVIEAASGEEALALLSEHPIDCVLLDLIMPGISGQETCRRIKDAPILRTIPVIMLTSLQDSRAMIEGLSAGADDFIDKANDFEILHARVMAQIRRKQFEDENRMIREKLLCKELEAKEARAAQQAQYGRMLNEIVDALPDATILVDRNGNIVFASDQTMRMFGYRQDELDGQPCAILFTEDSRPLTSLLYETNEIEDEKRPTKSVFDVAGVESSGRSFPAEVSQSLLKAADGTYVISTIRDISRRRLLEEEVKAIEVAKRTSAAKSQFLASMSHEIRTPLNGIIGTLELLGQTHLEIEQFELVSQSDKAAKSLLALIGNILDFSKIEAGKLTIEMGELNPVALVANAVEMIQSVARQKGIFVTALFGTEVPSVIRGDSARITQILVNLIGNAIKFTAKGGVELRLDVESWDHDVCELRFEVHDSGRGFDPNLAERLFEPFEQSTTPGRLVEGTGLGLAICRSLVDAFGGIIGCQGVPDQGATFWFTLPATVVKRAPPVAPADLAGKRVSLLGSAAWEDDGLKAYFTARGAEVAAQTEIEAGFAQLSADAGAGNSFDVAVMAECDLAAGEFAEAASRLRELHAVPLLLSDGRDGPRHHSLRDGFAVLLPHSSRLGAELRDRYLDRNVRVLLGQAPSPEFDRFAELQSAIERDYVPRLAGRRVLVLEDRLVNQFVIDKQLKKLQMLSVMVTDGIRGLEVLESECFDLILCDCSMPRMNGFEFTRAWRRREAQAQEVRRIPIIALTANAFREDIDRCFEAGMDDFVSKPVTLDRLTAVLAKWLGQEPAEIEAQDAAAMPSDAAPPIDLRALGEMIGSHDRDSLVEILSEFGVAAEESLIQLQHAVETGNKDEIHDVAHGGKGEARSAGADKLASLYADLEKCAKQDALQTAPLLARAVAAEVDRVKQFTCTVSRS